MFESEIKCLRVRSKMQYGLYMHDASATFKIECIQPV